MDIPVCIIHSKDDQLIPYTQALYNYKLIPHDKKHFISINGSHSNNNAFLNPTY